MMDQKTLGREIHQLIDQALDANRVLPVQELADSLGERHPGLEPEMLQRLVDEVVDRRFNPRDTPAGHLKHAEELERYCASRGG